MNLSKGRRDEAPRPDHSNRNLGADDGSINLLFCLRENEMSKWKKGEKITGVLGVINRINRRAPVYFNNKFMAAGFIEHWSVIQIQNAIKSGRIFEAIEIKEDTTCQ